MWIVRSASDTSTIVVGVGYDQLKNASDISVDEVSPSRPEPALHKDSSHKPPKQDGYSDWENNLKLETKNAKARTESWAKIADGVTVFVRHKSCHKIALFSPRGVGQASLFSVVLVTFVLLSFLLLQPDPADTTNRLLTTNNQLLAQVLQSQQSSSNGTGSPQPSSPADDSSFRPRDFAVRVNTVWLVSLSFSTSCALLAILLQQWALKFMQAADKADSAYSLSQRSRIYAFFLVGVERFALPAGVELLSLFLHISLFLFLTGLVDFLVNVNPTVGHIMMAWVSLAFLVYFIFTIMPLFIHNSPIQTPLSLILWFVMEVIILLGLYLCKWSRIPITTVPNAIYRHQIKIWKGMRRSSESMAIQSTSLKPLDEETDSEEFLGWLYELYHVSAWFKSQYSERLKDGLERLVTPAADKLFTSSPHLNDSHLRSKRFEICLKAVWCFHGTVDRHYQAIRNHLDDKLNSSWDPWGPLSAETWKMALDNQDKSADSDSLIALRAHFIQALMAVTWKENKWQCASHEATMHLMRQLGASSVDIERWNTSGDQLKLAVAANLLSKSLPLLRKLETGPHVKLRIELKEILNKICYDLDGSDVPGELRARFVDRAKVERVFPQETFNGPWTKVFNPPSIGVSV